MIIGAPTTEQLVSMNFLSAVVRDATGNEILVNWPDRQKIAQWIRGNLNATKSRPDGGRQTVWTSLAPQ